MTEPRSPAGSEPSEPADLPEPAGGAEPTGPLASTTAAEPSDRLARQVALGFVAFIATGLLLVGLSGLVRELGSGEPAPTVETGSSASPDPGASGGGASSGPAASGSGAASASPSTLDGDPVLIGAGDIADCSRDADAETAALLVSEPGIVFTAGDNVYPSGSETQFADCYGPTWGRELARTRPVPGNHDHETAGLAGYLGYFGEAAAPDGTAWYSYDVGTWHVIALDSSCALVGGCGPDSPQGRWLAADLAASDALCTLAIWHHPRFSSGQHGSNPSVAPFWDALHAAGADVIVNGHDHDYERFAPQRPDGLRDPTGGIRQFVVGTGGAELRAFGTQAANSELRAAGYFGVLRLVLHDASYEWSFLTTAGPVLDAGNTNCH